MKKQLIVMAGLTAMFAACTNEDALENFGTNEVAKTEGITFSIVDDVESRGDFKMDEATKKFMANWNAEVDKINVAYYGAWKGVESNTLVGNVVSTWNGTLNAVRGESTAAVNLGASAVYKATKTAARGEFTSLDEDNLLTFTTTVDEDGNEIPRLASFRAYRGTNATINYSTDEDGVETMAISYEVLATQTQASATKAPFDNFVMVSDPIEEICNLDYAVGESLPLSFERAFSGLVISTTGYNKDIYGALKSVKVSMDESVIAGNVTLNIANKDENGKWTYDATGANNTAVTLNIGTEGLVWSDDYHAFIQILPVDRSALRASELYEVELTFENGTIVVEKSSSKNWEANNFYTVNVDLNEAGNYLYNNQVLTVIKALPTLNASNAFDGVNASSVTKIVSGKVLTADELAVIKAKYTGVTEFVLANEGNDLGANLNNLKTRGVTSLKLTAAKTAPVITSYSGLTIIDCPEVTTIPDGAFKGNTVSFAKLNFPKVQTIGKEAFSGATGITEVSCAEAGNGKLTIGTTKTENGVTTKTSALTTVGEKAFAGLNLTTVDAPALTTMGNYPFGTNTSGCSVKNLLLPAYDWAASTDLMTSLYLLANNDKLETVDFSGTTTIAGTTVPKMGSTLKTVILAANTNLGAGAFAGQTNTDFAIVNINKVASVADNAFAGSKLSDDIKFENTVANIGLGAFYQTEITSFDFTGVETIGEYAFGEITTLNMITIPSVEVLEEGVFGGCEGITAAQFDAATSLKKNALAGFATGANVVFKKAITTFEGNPFGEDITLTDENKNSETPATATINYNLYVDAAQEGVDGNTLTYKSGDYYYKLTFTKIVK